MSLPLPGLPEILGVTVFCILMAGASYYRKIFDLSGSASAFVVGMVIGICGSVLWLILLLIFLGVSFGATKYRFDWKRSKGFQEGAKGERTWRNVAANGAIPTLVAFLSFVSEAVDPVNTVLPKDTASFLFVTAIAAAASDTAASEIGIIDPRVYLITNSERVPQGTDGGVSLTGELAAFVAAAFTSAVAYFFFAVFNADLIAGPSTLLIPMLCGFLGCQIDSVIGATWERKGRIGKLGNNFTSIALSTLIALSLAVF